jgi:hypothetical protein
MPRKNRRTEDSFSVLQKYLRETNLTKEVDAICKRHHVMLRDIFFDDRGKAAKIARMDLWHYLIEVHYRSHQEIARMFARECSTVTKAMKQLRERAAELQRVVDQEKLDVASAAAKIIALDEQKRQRMFGKLMAKVNFDRGEGPLPSEVAPEDDGV